MRKVIATGVFFLCLASICYAGSFFVKEGDVYRMAHDNCPKAQSAEVIRVAAATLEPGSLLVWPEKESKEPSFRALTYAGIEDSEIVLIRDPGPSIRLPIKGVFTRYGILDIAGFRIILDVVYPDKIKAKVRHAAKRCRCM
jgi:hypothetical protein